MEKKAVFYQHRSCEYFPCHQTQRPEDFNCLFCYCPLYTLGDRCGGDFIYLDNGVKSCRQCLRPHGRDSYLRVSERFSELSDMARSNGKK